MGRADPRNITDKRYVPTNIRVLIDYLTAHGFDHTISPKILTSPTAKDFNNIVQFLFRQVDSNLSCPGKFEDEVISMFKYLRYPYPISKNGLSAVGSPHSWPQLLASVMWLIELLEYDSSAQSETHEDEEDEGASEKAFFSYLRSAYIAFLSGDDPYYQQLEDEFINSFENKNVDINAQREALERENAALQREIEEVENRRQYLPQLQEKKRDYEADKGKFETLIDQLYKHKESLETKVSSRKAELDKLLSNSALVQEDITALRAKIASQELSPEDVRRMLEEKEHLQDSLRTASDNNSVMAKRVWETETLLREKVTSLEDLNREYTMLAEDLELLPATARNAQGRDISLHIDIRAKKRSDLLQSDVRGMIQPFLQQLKLEVNASTAELQGDAMAIADDIEEVEVQAAKLREEQTVVESKLRRVEEAYRREKEALEAMVAAHDSEMDKLEAKLLRLRDVSGDELALSTATRRLKDLRKQRAANKEQYKASKQALIEEIMDVVTECANYREQTQQRLTEVRELFNLKLHSLLLDNGGHPFRGSASRVALNREPSADAISITPDAMSIEISTGHHQLRASDLKSSNNNSFENMMSFNNEDGVSVSPIAAPYSSRGSGREHIEDDSYVSLRTLTVHMLIMILGSARRVFYEQY